jgi:tetratricopeptide (TPR) repeat protein
VGTSVVTMAVIAHAPNGRGISEAMQTTLIDQARDAAGQGEWHQALDLLGEADACAPLSRPDLAFLADVGYAAGRLDVTIDAWERAHAQSVRAGDPLSAAEAAVRVALHLLFDTALMAPVRGWIKRAERLLEGHDETPVHAWLAVVRNYERLLSGDFQGARHWARQAIEVGTKCDPAAAAMGRVAEARGLVLNGDVQQGLGLLNEAAVAAVSGELAPLATGVVYCELVCAFQAVAQYDLAEEWTVAMERWRHGQPVGSIHGRCRVHRAEILRLRGSYDEAEKEALLACEELRPYLRREFGWPLTELGSIRLRRGDNEGAEEAFLAAHEVGWDPQPGLALVQLAKGEVALAAASLRDALDHPLNVPSKEFPPNTELRRAPLLEAQVEIAVAAGDLDLARAAADELSHIAALFESKAFAASAALARGRIRLAEGETARARRDFDVAAHLWHEIGAPYETALARLGLGRAHRAAGNEERAVLEFQAARLGFERVGAVHQAAEATRACGNVGRDESRERERLPQAHSAIGAEVADKNVFRREGDYWSVRYEGQTVRLRDLKGMRYLARLLAAPGREFHALDLVGRERGWSRDADRSAEPGLAFSAGLDGGVLLDAQAKVAYRKRLAEIEEDIEEARAMGDDERAAQAEGERDFLIRELARAVGLDGRDRHPGSAPERARASVTRAMRHAMARIHECHPSLGEHLDRTIRTGTYCAYLPDPRVPPLWNL